MPSAWRGEVTTMAGSSCLSSYAFPFESCTGGHWVMTYPFTVWWVRSACFPHFNPRVQHKGMLEIPSREHHCSGG